MKTLRQTCAATILLLALAVSVLAGEVDCPGVAAPLPPSQQVQAETTAPPMADITDTLILVIIDLIR